MAMVLTAFLARVKPVSTMANPACMNITRNPASKTQAIFSAWSMGSPCLSGRSRVGARRGAVAEPDHGGERAEDRDDDQRGAQPDGNEGPLAPPPGRRLGVVGRDRPRVLEVLEQLHGARVAVAGIALDRLHDDRLQRG